MRRGGGSHYFQSDVCTKMSKFRLVLIYCTFWCLSCLWKKYIILKVINLRALRIATLNSFLKLEISNDKSKSHVAKYTLLQGKCCPLTTFINIEIVFFPC